MTTSSTADRRKRVYRPVNAEEKGMENGLYCETVGWRAEGKTEKHQGMHMGAETSDCITTACGIFDELTLAVETPTRTPRLACEDAGSGLLFSGTAVQNAKGSIRVICVMFKTVCALES